MRSDATPDGDLLNTSEAPGELWLRSHPLASQHLPFGRRGAVMDNDRAAVGDSGQRVSCGPIRGIALWSNGSWVASDCTLLYITRAPAESSCSMRVSRLNGGLWT